MLVVTQQGLLNHMQGKEEVSGEDVLMAVQTAVRVNMSVKSIRIEGKKLRWTNVATATLKGACENSTLKQLELMTPKDPHHPQLQEVVDEVRQEKPNLRLVVQAGGESA